MKLQLIDSESIGMYAAGLFSCLALTRFFPEHLIGTVAFGAFAAVILWEADQDFTKLHKKKEGKP